MGSKRHVRAQPGRRVTALTTGFSKTVDIFKPMHGCWQLLGLSGRAGCPPRRVTYNRVPSLQGHLQPLCPALGCAACGLLPRGASSQLFFSLTDSPDGPCHGTGGLVVRLTYTIAAETSVQA